MTPRQIRFLNTIRLVFEVAIAATVVFIAMTYERKPPDPCKNPDVLCLTPPAVTVAPIRDIAPDPGVVYGVDCTITHEHCFADGRLSLLTTPPNETITLPPAGPSAFMVGTCWRIDATRTFVPIACPH